MGSFLPIRWPSKDHTIAFLITAFLIGLSWGDFNLSRDKDAREIGLFASALIAIWFIWSLILSREVSVAHAVRQRTTQLSALVSYLQGSLESDRLALSRELHDELGALLTLAKLDVARLTCKLPNMPSEASDCLKELTKTLNDGLTLKTKIIDNLRPQTLSHLGLRATLTNYTEEFSRRSNIQVDLKLRFELLDEKISLTVFRLVQESLTNVLRHAHAGHLTVTVEEQVGDLEIVIRDDGGGFNPLSTKANAYGLSGMLHRAQSLGGKFEVSSKLGEGTTIRAWLPLTAPVAVRHQSSHRISSLRSLRATA
jgi:signal transduction histidine kinase